VYVQGITRKHSQPALLSVLSNTKLALECHSEVKQEKRDTKERKIKEKRMLRRRHCSMSTWKTKGTT